MISGIGKHENDMHCISARYTCKDKATAAGAISS